MSCLEKALFTTHTYFFRRILCAIYENFIFIAVSELYENGIHVAVVCIPINIFHFYVLSRKAMRSSPIYILLAAIALMDICSFSYDIHFEIVDIFKTFNVCFSKAADYNMIIFKNTMESIRYNSRRCSTWLSFSITLIRTLVIKYPMHPNLEILSKPKSAFFIIIGVILLFTPIHVLDYFKYDPHLINEHYKCTQHPESNIFFYENGISMFFQYNEMRIYKFHRLTDALLSKVVSSLIFVEYLRNLKFQIIPSILFPIVTVILIREIRKAGARRQNLGTSSTASQDSKNTSRLVLALTIPFFIAELPLGIVSILVPNFYSDNGFYFVFEAFEKFFSFILSATTATHMIICVFMSSQYRETALLVVRCGQVFKKKQESVVLGTVVN
ncbi:hypothetical protein CRE_24406 [Caenorhabditis remanei]|uniref:G-protein coupled receptors family 1 profile domain-containing protein n=1 Tax=Caenorhabditis remanei TaxID=31234 RepID=E3MFU2_CAERE|nr:hypothetical protein CRE_24406 [Caenorhabditis remanei]